MNKEFIPISQILECGTDLINPHVRWLIRHAVTEHCPIEAINIICYNKDIPNTQNKKLWGQTYAPGKCIVINLEEHFYSCINRIQDTKHMHNSLKLLILHELLDTSLHESHHLKTSHESNNFNDSDLEQQEAEEIGKLKSWMAAKHWDVEIQEFGPTLDNLIKDFFIDLVESEKEKPEMWKMLQIYMWTKNIAYYNPDEEKECNMRQAFESYVDGDNPWIDPPKLFSGEITKTAETTVPMWIPTAEPSEVINELHGDIYDEYGGQPDLLEQSEPQQTPQQFQPFQPITITPAPILPTETSPIQQTNKETIQKAAEEVIRALFFHVMSKCGFNSQGGYNNPTAVLEPVNIQHIENATELFSHMDTMDTNGVYSPNQPCNGFIKGLISKQKLPMYRIYMNIGGQLLKRTLIPQNPNKLDGNDALTKWAKEARQGYRIMMYLEDEVGVRADIKLAPGTSVGQEEFKIWEK